ncbi:MAG: hypothetical protein ACXV8P_09125 [Methylobacter sp.]
MFTIIFYMYLLYTRIVFGAGFGPPFFEPKGTDFLQIESIATGSEKPAGDDNLYQI